MDKYDEQALAKFSPFRHPCGDAHGAPCNCLANAVAAFGRLTAAEAFGEAADIISDLGCCSESCSPSVLRKKAAEMRSVPKKPRT